MKTRLFGLKTRHCICELAGTRMLAMSKYQCTQSGVSHPYAHKIRMKPTTSYIESFSPQRSLTITNLQITPRTTFEMERPHSQGVPKVVVINTSFRTSFLERRPCRKHIPTFPKLATDSPTPGRLGDKATGLRISSGQGWRSSSRIRTTDREHSSRSDRHTDRHTGQNRTFLTQRQTNTFAAYAKYNEVVKSANARDKEKAAESPITSNINDLSALVPEKMYNPTDELLSSEKHIWISDWIASTSAALNLESGTEVEGKSGSKTLSVIHEH